MKKNEKKIKSWMINGARVIYSPSFVPNGTNGASYEGTIMGAPFQIGNPKNDRWVVRLECMDDKYQNAFNRNCVSCVGIDHISPTELTLPALEKFDEH